MPAVALAGPMVEVVVPVHNEQEVLEASIWRLHGYLKASFPFSFRITIADNASTDATWPWARVSGSSLGSVCMARWSAPRLGATWVVAGRLL